MPTAAAKPALACGPSPFHRSRAFVTMIGGSALAVAVGAFAAWYYSTVKALTKSADTASAQLASKYKAPIAAPVGAVATPIGATPGAMPTMPMPKMVGASAPESAGSSPASPPPPTRATAPNAVRIGDLNVSLVSANLGRLNRVIAGQYLSLRVKVTNLSKSPIKFASWGRSKVPVILKDKEGIFYNIRPSGDDEIPIPPGKSITDALLFEPTSPFTQLDLDLPIAGTDQSFRFHTPPGFIKQAMVPLEELQPIADASAPAPAAPAPLPPEKDPEVRKKVIAEYRETGADIRQRSLGMGTNDARNYRRRADKDLRKKLGERYHLNAEQVSTILREGG